MRAEPLDRGAILCVWRLRDKVYDQKGRADDSRGRNASKVWNIVQTHSLRTDITNLYHNAKSFRA